MVTPYLEITLLATQIEISLVIRNNSSDASSWFRSAFLFIYWTGVEPSPLLLRSLVGLLYQSWITDGEDCEGIGGTNDCQGKSKYSEKTCPTAAVFTTVLT
jgi:hypothetical protein